MPMLISTGKCPSPSGRKTSALSLVPSRIGMSTSFSIFILYRGSDALVSSWVATCSCTLPPNDLACASNATREQGLRLCRRRPDTSRRAPYLARGLDHEAELGELAFLVHRVAADAAGKSALRAQCELLQRGVLARPSMRRLSSSFDSSLALLVVTRPRMATLPLGRKRSGSKPPARALSYSRK